MEPEPTVLDSLRRAVEAMPDDVPLRLHLATMLMRGGQRDEAIRQVGAVHDQLERPQFQVRFRWEPDSIAFWDNRATAHLGPVDLATAESYREAG